MLWSNDKPLTPIRPSPFYDSALNWWIIFVSTIINEGAYLTI